ncbi:hypothetical protein J4E86_010136 [Alternaria arbusti]|uniref:uncharacterized protein n=1 Tax=Alternaria arbusti TaxID=232088 RepID=UPI0022201F08|nr:uncharacterized protein J4E86_010136 [Alternaria arbusti]KAI4942334.1 hypothetical protein J4E86_010136 [Alternaria arbusti]
MAALITDLDEHARRLARDIQQHCTNAQTRLNNVLKQTDIQPKAALYSLLLFAAFTYFTIAVTNLIRARRLTSSRPSTPNLEKRSPFKAPDRPPGVWLPSDFTRPPATPYPSFDLSTTKPLPYRPFRHGPKYNITMGLRNMQWDEWIELDNQYMEFHRLKAERIEERGGKCVKTAPEARAAVVELLEELCFYLPQRYPTVFQKISHSEKMGEEKAARKIQNLATGEIFDIARLERNGVKEDAMALCARLVQDDLAIMVEKEDGHFKTKLEKPMSNFFRRIQPQSPVLRNNYFIQVDDNLAWSSSIGPEDTTEEEGGVGWFTAEKNKAVEHHWFRSERQSLRRLPKSGGVVFTIRTYFHPITEIAQEPYVPGRLASAIRSWGDDVSRYKGKEMYGDVLLEYLDRRHQEQVEAGLDVGAEEGVRGYPF